MDSNLVLGTAQLGMPYGIANKTGQPDQNEANEIIREAWEHGICEFDTAQGYGTSEEVLGNALLNLGINKKVKIITKFHPDLNILNADLVAKAIDNSLLKLKAEKIYGVLLHREEILINWDRGLLDIIRQLISAGKIQYAGISVYSPQKALQALNTNKIDILQLPTNILDRRFESAEVFNIADKQGKRVYIRSVYLQGLLLLKETEIPEKMSFVRPVLAKIESVCNEMGLSSQELAIGYIKSAFPNARIIFGAEKREQIRENILAWEKQYSNLLIDKVRRVFNNCEERVLNPTLWH
jgi:aryl-alcohol dehydrogenase-like predicted oxidoreductase